MCQCGLIAVFLPRTRIKLSKKIGFDSAQPDAVTLSPSTSSGQAQSKGDHKESTIYLASSPIFASSVVNWRFFGVVDRDC